MSKKAVIILTATALIVGAIIGGWSVAALFNNSAKLLIHRMFQTSVESHVGSAYVEVEALTYLQVGRTTNAINSLEFHLESDLIELEPYVVASNEFKSDSWNIEVLRKVKDYRARFPYKTNPGVETNVAELLTSIDAQTNR